MPSTYTLISSNVLSSSAASVTFSAIPSTYTDLVLRMSTRSSGGGSIADSIRVRFNSDSATNYSYTYLFGYSTGGSDSVQITNDNYIYINNGSVGNTATANTFSSAEIYLPSYTLNQNKPLSIYSVLENNAASAYMEHDAVLYRSTSAISSIEFSLGSSADFVSGSSFYLYGIKNS
jgi:hypothetical protein